MPPHEPPTEHLPSPEQISAALVEERRAAVADKLFGDLAFIADLDELTGWSNLDLPAFRARVERLGRRLEALAEVAQATPSRSDRYHPGDAAKVVTTHVGSLYQGLVRSTSHGTIGSEKRSVVYNIAAQLELAAHAVPFWMPPAAGVALAASYPPEAGLVDRIRLPYPAVLVLFGAPLHFGPAAHWQTSSTDGRRHWSVLHDEGGTLHGVVLLADDEGLVRDIALYLLGLGVAADATRTLVAGQLRQGAFSGVVRNAASIVSWGAWKAPDPSGILDLDESPAAVRDQVRRGAYRRRAATGAALGAHVIDLGRNAVPHDVTASPGTSAVATHLRRGHWRRVRVGPRADWHYGGRWIAPTVVNAAAGDAPDVLYRLPPPPSGPPPDDGEDDLTT